MKSKIYSEAMKIELPEKRNSNQILYQFLKVSFFLVVLLYFSISMKSSYLASLSENELEYGVTIVYIIELILGIILLFAFWKLLRFLLEKESIALNDRELILTKTSVFSIYTESRYVLSKIDVFEFITPIVDFETGAPTNQLQQKIQFYYLDKRIQFCSHTNQFRAKEIIQALNAHLNSFKATVKRDSLL